VPLEYLKLHESPGFGMGVFCFPAAAVVPLHNHPLMTVMSKLLYGKVRYGPIAEPPF
jgi:quercetin dioxygenase-like cupin family protein